MKNLVIAAIALFSLAFYPTLVAAQEAGIEGSYSTKFDAVANNCESGGRDLSNADVALARKGDDLVVTIPGIPKMTGKVRKGGKIKAEVEKKGNARYAVSGRSTRGKLQMVFIAEYYKSGKPFCTQSWNVTGTRK